MAALQTDVSDIWSEQTRYFRTLLILLDFYVLSNSNLKVAVLFNEHYVSKINKIIVEDIDTGRKKVLMCRNAQV